MVPNNSILECTSGAWVPITDTNTTKLFTTNGNNFLWFSHGRLWKWKYFKFNDCSSNYPESHWQLITGQVDYISLPSASHTLIGNPYASPLYIATMFGTNAGFSGYFWVCNANLVGDYSVGGYNLFDTITIPVANYTNLTGNADI